MYVPHCSKSEYEQDRECAGAVIGAVMMFAVTLSNGEPQDLNGLKSTHIF